MKNLNKNTSIIITALFSALAVIMVAAMGRAYVYGELIITLVHAGFFIVFFVGYSIFAKSLFKDKLPPKTMKIVFAVYISLFIVLMALLFGFQKVIVAIIVAIIYMAVPFWFIFEKGQIQKSAVAFVLVVTILFGLTVPGYFYKIFEISIRENNQELYVSEDNGYFVHSVSPEKLYVFTPQAKTNAEVLLYNSLQAYTCMKYTDQIIFESDENNDAKYIAQHLDTLLKYYPEVAQQRVDSLDELLDIYEGRINNYILYDDNDKDSLFVASNLCNQKDAVMVGKSLKQIADDRGWTQVFDTTGWTEERFMASDYFDNLDRHLLVMVGPLGDDMENEKYTATSDLWDLAIMNNAWIINCKYTIPELENRLKLMDRNSICLGSRSGNAENAVVQACARYATTFSYTAYVPNISVLSGFDFKNATVNSNVLNNGQINKLEPTMYSDDSTPKHTVCVMLSDADNMRFCSESLRNVRYYQSPLRDENLQYNIGLAGSLVEIAPIFLLEFYDDMYSSNDFCYQLSSVGYTYPSKWTDKEAWEQVTKSIARIMKESKTNVLEIMDDSAFWGVLDIPSDFGSLQKYFDTYTCYDEVDGCLFIDYTALYAGYRGAICWSNDKPVVSAKYSVWRDEGTPYNSKRNEIDYIVKEINEMSTDKTSEDAYTFIIVHGWSGLNENGELDSLRPESQGVDGTAIFTALRDGFDEDVEMVTTTEFINRMRRNVKR